MSRAAWSPSSYGKTSLGKMEPNSELIIGPAKRGPSSPKIIVDSNLTVQNSSAIRPTPLKAGKTITHLDSSSPSQVKIQA